MLSRSTQQCWKTSEEARCSRRERARASVLGREGRRSARVEVAPHFIEGYPLPLITAGPLVLGGSTCGMTRSHPAAFILIVYPWN